MEGIDGSGKSTQLSLLSQWLRSQGYAVAFSEWNSSPLVKQTTRRGKKKEMFTPTTFSLIHATDFADRLEGYILPLLQGRRHRLRRPLRLHRLRARRGARRRAAAGCAISTASPSSRIWRSISACRSMWRWAAFWAAATR